MGELFETLLFLLIVILWGWLSTKTSNPPRRRRIPMEPAPRQEPEPSRPPEPAEEPSVELPLPEWPFPEFPIPFPQEQTPAPEPPAPSGPQPLPIEDVPESAEALRMTVLPTEPAILPEASPTAADEVVDWLRAPDTAARAVLLTEILAPPRSKRRRF